MLSRSGAVTLLLPLLSFGGTLGVGLWGTMQLAADDSSTTVKQRGLGCVVGTLILLALAATSLLSALFLSRRRHRDLLEALLPRQVLQSLDDDDVFRRTGTDTPANLLLNMMGDLLDGKAPRVQDVLFIRTALMSNTDVYQPFNLRATIKDANLDADVAQSLMNQLGGFSVEGSSARSTHASGGGAAKFTKVAPAALGAAATAAVTVPAGNGEFSQLPSEVSVGRLNGTSQQACESLSSALALLLTPQPAVWQDATSLQDDLTGDLTTTGLELKSPPPPPLAAVVAAAAAALVIDRRTPIGFVQAQHLPAGGLLEKAVSLIDRSRRRRQMNVEPTPMVAPSATVVDVTRDAVSKSSLYTPGSCTMGRRGSTAGSTLCSNGVRLDFRRASFLIPSAATDEHVSIAAAATAAAAANGSIGGAVDDDSATGTTMDYESCGGGVTPAGLTGGEALVPRRLSAVWGMLSKRGTGHLSGSRKVSLDGNPTMLGASGGRASPAFSPGSLLVRRASSTQSPLTHVASELLQHTHSRLGLGAGVGGGVFRTTSIRTVADAALTGMGTNSNTATAAVAAAATGAAIKRSMPPPSSVIDEVERMLASADSWQFNTWALQEATQGHALSALSFYLIQKAGLIKVFQIKPVTLARVLRQVETGYLDNPYHNAVHAADVLQTLHVMIHATQLHVHYLDHLGLLAAYYAAIVHDYGHPGLTNDFLVATSDLLAVRYNDRSPLENHHCAASFGLLQRPELDFLAPLTKAERSSFRKQVIELVLATDMKQHFSILSHFNTVHRLGTYSQAAPTSTSPNKPGRKTLRRMVSHTISETAPDPVSAAFSSYWAEPPPKPVDETERLLSLQVAFKVADIGHLGEELEVHKRWLGVLEEEFFRQGDRERDLGLPISPLFDRSKQGVSKSQVGFYEFVALPLVHALSCAFPGAQHLMKCFVRNYNHWRQVDGQPPVDVPIEKTGIGRRSVQAANPATTTGAAATTITTTTTTAVADTSSPSYETTAATVFTPPARISEQGGLNNLLLTIPDNVLTAENDSKV